MHKPPSQQVPDFYQNYVAKVPDRALVAVLTEGQQQTESLLQSLTEEQWLHRYSPGKWSLKESFLHMIDAERYSLIGR